ncbi:permease [Phenylobacterium aquaticum]|uniref:permease n=1 Tax=Phenylobacterium aquaticum TaxID=1763816 RepID=UPI0026EB9E2B|nr:permease [Phenylobacterium aquaticum]
MSETHLVPAALGLLAFCVAAETVQQLAFKTGADRASASGGPPLGVALQPLIWLGVGLWAVESIAWVLVLQRAPLSLAYPIMTATYATVPLGGLILLRERMTGRQRLGAGLIFAGVLCVGLSGL